MSVNISCSSEFCPMCKTNSPPLTDKRSALSCLGCDTLFHKKCAKNLNKLENGAFAVCCDDSADRSILAPPSTDDDCDLDLENLPDSFQISGVDLNKIIKQAASQAVKETISSFSSSIESVNKRIMALDSKTIQLENNYKDLADKIQEAELTLKDNFENNCDLMYAEFSDRDSRKNNLILHGLSEDPVGNLDSQVKEILKKLVKFDLSSIKISRIGNEVPSVTRPVRIKIPNRDHIFEVINNKKKWPKNLSFSLDRTLMQRSIMKKYIEIVKEHNNKNPEDKLSIKFFKNIPTVINSKNVTIYPNSINTSVLNNRPTKRTSTPNSKNSPELENSVVT